MTAPPRKKIGVGHGDALVATGDGMWVHDTQTEPRAAIATGHAPGALLTEHQNRIHELEGELADAKREIDELMSAREIDFLDETTLPRAQTPQPSIASSVKSPAKGAVALIPRLPPRPNPSPPVGFSPRGTLKMAPSVSELPLPPASRAPPPMTHSHELGSFEAPPLPHFSAPDARGERHHTWLFALLALASTGLAVTGYAVIAELGPFAPIASARDTKPIESAAMEPSAPQSSSTEVVSTGKVAALPESASAPIGVAAAPAPSVAASPAPSIAQPIATPSASSIEIGALPPSVIPSAPASDVGALLSFQGALTVHSPVAADVVVQGVLAGRTNEPLVVRCGPKNVRLRDTQWITDGQPVQIDCMRLTEVTIAPAPLPPQRR